MDKLQPAIQHLLYGAVTATQAVLPAMLAASAGRLLYTAGGGAINPYPMFATLNTAQAALRNWVYNLHNTLADQGIHAATVAINLLRGTTAPMGERRPCPRPPTPSGRSLHSAWWGRIQRAAMSVVVGTLRVWPRTLSHGMTTRNHPQA
ncbi:SDR family NAD(P)-dependent oxidoreductase [Actinopolymorpha pittospori]